MGDENDFFTWTVLSGFIATGLGLLILICGLYVCEIRRLRALKKYAEELELFEVISDTPDPEEEGWRPTRDRPPTPRFDSRTLV
ncbi:unnamed protein product [Chrysodeixis includens]|uniref:Uncharacterized protein n=1 Tax=Chrysodeixis includens TaxID=689277 RepID=A0A9P0BKE3_CHRIL|nr:unnamed protein product [Chrysodeixis includens]